MINIIKLYECQRITLQMGSQWQQQQYCLTSMSLTQCGKCLGILPKIFQLKIYQGNFVNHSATTKNFYVFTMLNLRYLGGITFELSCVHGFGRKSEAKWSVMWTHLWQPPAPLGTLELLHCADSDDYCTTFSSRHLNNYQNVGSNSGAREGECNLSSQLDLSHIITLIMELKQSEKLLKISQCRRC